MGHMQLCGELPCTSWSAGGDGGTSYILRSHMPKRGAIYSVINWHVFLVGFSILFACVSVHACMRVVLTCWMVGGRTTTSAHTMAVHS